MRPALAGAAAALGLGVLVSGSAAAYDDWDDSGRDRRHYREYYHRGGHDGYGRDHGALHRHFDRRHRAWHYWNGRYADPWEHHRFHRSLDRRHRSHHHDFDRRQDRRHDRRHSDSHSDW